MLQAVWEARKWQACATVLNAWIDRNIFFIPLSFWTVTKWGSKRTWPVFNPAMKIQYLYQIPPSNNKATVRHHKLDSNEQGYPWSNCYHQSNWRGKEVAWFPLNYLPYMQNWCWVCEIEEIKIGIAISMKNINIQW